MSNKPRLLALTVSCMLLFAIGLISALGPALPNLARNTGGTLAEVGLLFSALFLGSTVMQLASGPLTDRFGIRPMLMAGCVVLAAGVLAVTFSRTLPAAVLCMLIGGLGDGVLVVVTNVLVVEAFSARRVAALNLSNVFFGLGAIAGPAVAAYSLERWQTAIPALWTLAIIVLLPIPLITFVRLPRHPSTEATEAIVRRSVYRAPLLWVFGGVLLLYVGTEVGIGGWGLTFLTRSTSLDEATAAFVMSAFWVAFTSGRVLAAVVGTFFSSGVLLIASFIGELAGVLLLIFGLGNVSITVMALLLVALCLGPIFPTVVAAATSAFPRSAARSAAGVMVMGSAGGFILPWVQGIVLVNFGTFGYLAFVLFCISLMLGLFSLARLFAADS